MDDAIDVVMTEFDYDKLDDTSIIPKEIDSGSISSDSDEDDDEVSA